MAAESIPSFSAQYSLPSHAKSVKDVVCAAKKNADIPEEILKSVNLVSCMYAFTLFKEGKFNEKIKLSFSFSKEGVQIDSSDQKAKDFFSRLVKPIKSAEIKFDFNFRQRKVVTNYPVFNTYPLRLPHLLLELVKTFGLQNLKICIVGPGAVVSEDGVSSSPQLIEMKSLFPNAEFLILDNDAKVLESLNRSSSSYDFLMMNRYLDSADLKEAYRTLFLNMQKQLNGLSVSKEHEGTQLDIKLAREKIKVLDFDILKSELKEEENGTFDIVIATLSITRAFEVVKVKDMDLQLLILAKFLKALKEEGKFYIDTKVLNFYENSEKNIVKLYLECLVGNKLEIKKIENSDFFTKSQGDDFSYDHLVSPQVVSEVSTISIIAVTKKSEKIPLKEIPLIEERFKKYLEDKKSSAQRLKG